MMLDSPAQTRQNNGDEPTIITYLLLLIFTFAAFFHLQYLSITSFSGSPHKTRSSAYNNSINEPSLTPSVRTSITMIIKVGSKQTLDGHQLSKKMNLIVPHQLKQHFDNLHKETYIHVSNILGHRFASKQNNYLPLAADQKPFTVQQIQKTTYFWL